MAEPWVKKDPGQLLSSADWNAMQRKAGGDIDAVSARVSAVEAALAGGTRRMRVLTATTELSGSGNCENQLGAWTTNNLSTSDYRTSSSIILGMTSSHPQYSTYGSSGNSQGYVGYWDFLPAPALNFTLSGRSVVIMHAAGQYGCSSSVSTAFYACMQFVLGQQGQRAPVRISSDRNRNCSSIWSLNYNVSYEPNADTWSKWLDDHHQFYTKNSKRWPMCGTTMVAYYYQQSTNIQALQVDEAVELPKGDYSLQLGFSTNASQSYAAFNVTNLSMSATIIPL